MKITGYYKYKFGREWQTDSWHFLCVDLVEVLTVDSNLSNRGVNLDITTLEYLEIEY